MHFQVYNQARIILAAFLFVVLSPGAKASNVPCQGCSKPLKTTVYFSADNNATLYLNGKPIQSSDNWHSVVSRTFPTSVGDCISIKVSSYSAGYGVIAQVVVNDIMVAATGVRKHDWRATTAVSVNGEDGASWNSHEFSTCEWSQPLRLNHKSLNAPDVRRAPFFPTKASAKYVWAAPGLQSSSTATKELYLRYRIGGEPCPFKLEVGAGKSAFVFVNGIIAASLYNSFIITTQTLTLRHGDVVSLRVLGANSWHGVVMSLGRYSTGVYRPWRAVKETTFEDAGDSFAWMYPGYDACSWPRAISALTDDEALPSFLEAPHILKSRNRFVKATGTSFGDSFQMRVRIGGGC